MKVTLSHRRHGLHKLVNEAEIPGTLADYTTLFEGGAYRIEEGKLLAALPPAFLPVPTETVLLTVMDDFGGTGQTDLTRFRSWAKYFDAYVLNLFVQGGEEPAPTEEPPAPVDILRRAAETVRQTAAKAVPGPWTIERTNGGDYVMDADRAAYIASCGFDDNAPDGVNADAAWIALTGPQVSEHLARTLEQHAEEHSSYDCELTKCAAVLLARDLLGEAGD